MLCCKTYSERLAILRSSSIVRGSYTSMAAFEALIFKKVEEYTRPTTSHPQDGLL